MALINNLYVCVTDESVDRSVEVTEHPVESGLPLTDNVKRNAIKLSISGYIVDYGKTKANTISDKLYSYSKNGQYVKYVGRYKMSNALITSFNSTYTNKVNGGCEFSMEIQEIRIAKSAYTAKKTTSQKQVTKKKTTTKSKRYYVVKKGDCLWNIAKKYYGDGSKYKKIYNANKKVIGKNPNLIFPKQKLEIPY